MKSKPNITLAHDFHHGKAVVTLRFGYNQELINRIKNIGGARWSQSKKCWYFLKDNFHLPTVFEALKPVSYIDYSALKTNSNTSQPQKKPKIVAKPKVKLPAAYIDVLDQQRYSESTKATYINYFGDYIRYFSGRILAEITTDEINNYLLDLIRNKKISASQQNQRINSIKFFYEKVLGREKQYFKIQRPKKEQKLPEVLSKEEIMALIESTSNKKHKAIISLLYSGGLRRGELIKLKWEDIERDRGLIRIRQGKGNKDRYTLLSKITLNHLLLYYKEYKTKEYIFENPNNGGKYSAESVGEVVKTAAIKAGIKKRVYPHILRHSFATHLLEKGVNLRYIQESLGHNDPRTTQIYSKVTQSSLGKISSPLDDLFNTSS